MRAMGEAASWKEPSSIETIDNGASIAPPISLFVGRNGEKYHDDARRLLSV